MVVRNNLSVIFPFIIKRFSRSQIDMPVPDLLKCVLIFKERGVIMNALNQGARK